MIKYIKASAHANHHAGFPAGRVEGWQGPLKKREREKLANPEHLKILKQGVEAWNKWRKENPDIRPDLSNTDLTKADLSQANLSAADLKRADLAEANLYRANLTEAHLSHAKLGGVNLSRADLSRANLQRADLKGDDLKDANFYRADLTGADLAEANLYRANLYRANLAGANFKGADLKNAKLYETILANVDLSNAKNLDSCRHFGPSIIDHRTLIKSGNLPEVFLRGCGLPDSLIEYYPSLLNQPIQRYSCFISYSSQDDEFAKRLHADLQDNNVRCWFAPADLKIGDKIRIGIDEAIRVHDKLFLILSENSIDSQWVEQEVETALEKERNEDRLVLFPIRIDDSVFDTKAGWAPFVKNSRHIGDFSNWKEHDCYKESFERILRDLKGES